MVAAFPFAVLVGTALGFLSGLGVGGGSLLMLWLTGVLGMAQAEARSVNLLFFVPSALIACLFRWRQGRLKLPVLLPAALAGCATAWLFSRLSIGLDTALLKKLFGALLLLTGLSELLHRTKAQA